MSIEEVKKDIFKNIVILTNEDDVRFFCHGRDCENKQVFVKFTQPSLRNLFISLLSERYFINANSSTSRFIKDMEGFDENVIFTNVKSCKDLQILLIIRETNNIMI